jgi:hypothetical protein
MIKTQVQLPNDLYHTAKAVAEQREWSFAEVVRRGLEHMALAYPLRPSAKEWKLPVMSADDFQPDFDHLDLKALSESDELGDL